MLGSSRWKLRRLQAAYPIGYGAVTPSMAAVVSTEVASHGLVHSQISDNFIGVYVQRLHSRRIEAVQIAVLKYANDRIYPSAGMAAQAAPLSPRKPVTSR